VASEQILIKGAREHNLKDIDLALPRGKLIVFTGISGSGKSSLAFDTIYAEGQRRYVESLSAYARQFLGQMDKPDVDCDCCSLASVCPTARMMGAGCHDRHRSRSLIGCSTSTMTRGFRSLPLSFEDARENTTVLSPTLCVTATRGLASTVRPAI